MRGILNAMAWIILLANIALMAGASLHFVHNKDGWDVVMKNQLTLVDTFVDPQTWSKEDLAAHPQFTARMEQVKAQSLLAEIRARALPQPPPPVAAHPVPPPTPVTPAPAPQPAPQSHPKSIFDDGIYGPGK